MVVNNHKSIKGHYIAAICLQISLVCIINPFTIINTFTYYLPYILGIIGLFAERRNISNMYNNDFLFWRYTFIIFALFSLFFISNFNIHSVEYCKRIFLHSIILLLCVVLNKQIGIAKIVYMYLFASTLFILYITITLGDFTKLFYERMSSGDENTWNPNMIGILLCNCILLYKLVENTLNIRIIKYKLFTIICAVIIFSLIFASGSRKALIALVLGLSSFYLVKSKNKIKLIFKIILIIIVIYLLMLSTINIPFLYDMIGYRLENLFIFIQTGDANEGSVVVRASMIDFGINLFKQKPIIGHGLNGFGDFFLDYKTRTYAHNNFVQLLVDGGILGFVIYYFIYIKIWIKCFFIKTVAAKIIIAYTIVLLILDYGIVSYINFNLQFALCMCICATCNLNINLKRQNENSK